MHAQVELQAKLLQPPNNYNPKPDPMWHGRQPGQKVGRRCGARKCAKGSRGEGWGSTAVHQEGKAARRTKEGGQ